MRLTVCDLARTADWYANLGLTENPEAIVVPGAGSLRITAVIDWGLSTLGHPLADLAYGWLPYHLTVEDTVGFGGVDPAELGIPTEVELLEV